MGRVNADDGVAINVRVSGTGSPVVLHHGFSDSLESWEELGYVAALVDQHQLICVDARGHGASDKPHDPAAYGRERMARDVLNVLDALGVAQAAFVGASMGGHVAQYVAAVAPQRLTRVVVMAAGPITARTPAASALTSSLQEGPDALVQFWTQQGEISDSLTSRLLANDGAALAAVLDGSSMRGPAAEQPLARFDGPVMVMAGDQDWDYTAITQMAAKLPGAEFVTLAGCNHLQSFTRTDLVLAHLAPFLAS